MSEPTEHQIQVPWPGKNAIPLTITSPPEDIEPSGYALLLGPGAGGDENTLLFKAIAKRVAQHGHLCARYRAKIPNLGFRVSLCKRVIEHVLHPKTGTHAVQGVFLGGHSMGTRVAGTVATDLYNAHHAGNNDTKSTSKSKAKTTKKKKEAAAEPTDNLLAPDFVRGLVLCSYPLHTPDNHKALRSEILVEIPASMPTLFISGLSDSMCKPDLFSKVWKDMRSSPREVLQVQGADHGLGFGSSKAAAGKKEALAESIADWIVAFMEEQADGTSEEEKGQTKIKGKQAKSNGGTAVRKTVEVNKAETAGEWTVAVSTVM